MTDFNNFLDTLNQATQNYKDSVNQHFNGDAKENRTAQRNVDAITIAAKKEVSKLFEDIQNKEVLQSDIYAKGDVYGIRVTVDFWVKEGEEIIKHQVTKVDGFRVRNHFRISKRKVKKVPKLK
jgi:ribose 1,5-bisphosphokinase PhnN